MQGVSRCLLVALGVLVPFAAHSMELLERPGPQLGYYVKEEGWSGEAGISHETVARPCFNADGTRLYCVDQPHHQPGRWSAQVLKMSGERMAGVAELGSGGPNVLAVVPSPDDKQLLLLVQGGDAMELALADASGRILGRLAQGLDPERSQFAWSSDGKGVYYTVAADSGEGLALKRVVLDGETHETVLENGVAEFDAARSADRVVALASGSLFLIERGEVRQTLEVQGRIEGLRVSPDGTKAAWGGERLVVYDVDAGAVIATTREPAGEPATDHRPAWSGDSTRVVFERVFHLGDAEGPMLSTCLVFFDPVTGKERQLEHKSFTRKHIEWSPAGECVYYDYIEIGAQSALDATSHEPTKLIPAPASGRWTLIEGPSGGAVRAYAVCPSDGRIVYAVADGLYRSDNAAETWHEVKMDPKQRPQGDVTSLAVDPGNANVLYAVTTNRLWRTDDGGASWCLHFPEDTDRTMLSVALHPAEPGVIYTFRGGRELARHDAEGMTELMRVKGRDPLTAELTVDARNPRLLILTDRHVAKRVEAFSTDGGSTWRRAAAPQGESAFLSLAGDKAYADLLLALAASGHVYFSADAGTTWERFDEQAAPGRWTDIVSAASKTVFALPPGKQAKDWPGEPLSAVRDAAEPGRIFMIGPGRALRRSDDGGEHWQPASAGLGKRHFSHMAAVPWRKRLLVAGQQFIHRTDDGGQTWATCAAPPGYLGTVADLAAHPRVSDQVFFSAGRYGVCRSTDGGLTWNAVVGDYKDLGVGWGWRFLFDPADPAHTQVFAEGGLLESTDGGERWRVASKFPPLPRRFHQYQAVSDGLSITACERANWRLFQTEDKGRTWRTLDGPFAGWRTMVLASRPDKPGVLYLATEYDAKAKGCVLWVSEDSGETWEARPLPELMAQPTALVCNPASPAMLAIGFDNGTVWLSFDEGGEWHDLGTGLARDDVEALAFSPDENRLYAKVRELYWIELPQQ